jgi:hypothetical protein
MKRLIVLSVVFTLALTMVTLLGCGGNSPEFAVTGLMKAMAGGANSSGAASFCINSTQYQNILDDFNNYTVTDYKPTTTKQAGVQEVGSKKLPSVIVEGTLYGKTQGESSNESCSFRVVNDGGTWKVYGVEGPSI